MSILTTIETIVTDVEHDVEGAIQTAETVVKVAWATVTGEIEADAKAFMGDVSTLWSQLLPAEYAIFKTLAGQVLGDAFKGDFADAETAILNAAEDAGHTFVATMGSPLIQTLLTMLKGIGL